MSSPVRRRLLWQCRRGTRETTLLLERFIQDCYDGLNHTEQRCLDALLECTEPELLGLLTGHVQAPDADTERLLQHIRTHLPPTQAASTMPPAWLQMLKDTGQVPAYTAAGSIAHLGDAAAELQAAGKSHLIADLSTLGVLRVQGPDARDFLRRILTNPVQVDEKQAEYGAICKPNGRVLADFILCARPDGLYLLPSLELVEQTRAELAKYVLASQVEIHAIQTQTARMGLVGEAAAAFLQGHCGEIPQTPLAAYSQPEYSVIRMPGAPPWFTVCGTPEALGAIWKDARHHGLHAGAAHAWALVEVTHRCARLSGTGSARHLPQALDLERLGTLDFHKGCYPGQEVIVRLSHRGKLKRSLHTLRSPLAFDGDEQIFQQDGTPAGEVVHAALHPEGGGLALAILTDTAVGTTLTHQDGTPVEIPPST